LPSSETGAVAGETVGHRYVLKREFGRGGMATVFLAEDRRLGKDVAIKFPRRDLFERPEARERFEREVRSLTQLDHRAIVKILDVGEHGDRPFVVMQYLAGGTLAERLQAADRKLPAPIALVAWITEIAAALDFTHAQNYLHRDVKPSNVLFDAAGNAYLSDFGIARAINADTSPPSNWGSSPGTPLYMAPEITDEVPLGPAYDQYALAVVVYQTLTGKIPHEAESGLRLMVKRATEPPIPLRVVRPDLPEALQAVVMRALDRAPERRFPGCRAFADAFRRACSALPRAEPLLAPSEVVAPPEVPPPPPPLWEPLAPPIPTELAAPPEADASRAPAPPPAPPPPRTISSRRRRVALVAATCGLAAVALVAFWPAGGAAKKEDGGKSATPPSVRAKEAAPAKPPGSTKSERGRGQPPLPERAPGVEGYERAKAFLLAKADWEATLGPTRDEVLAAPDLATWRKGAAELAAFVRDADALTLKLDESGTLLTERHRATAHGALVPDRPDLLRIEVSAGRAPSLLPLSGGRFAAEFDLGFDVAEIQAKFTRLDGTLLASLEIRVPEAAAATAASPPVPVAPERPAAADDPLATAGFRRADEKVNGRTVWIHEKSGLRFVELAIPEVVERTVPRFAPAEGELIEGADATRTLLVGETECTNGAWRKWRAAGVSADEADDLPLSGVGGPDVVAFCAAMGFELPYAAEWRWFALADAPSDLAATPGAFAVTAWFKQNADGDRHPVKQLAPNAFGLHDTQGNVWELCLADGETWSDVVARADAKSTVRPYLGGSCSSSAERCRIAKAELAHDGAGATRGFRPIFRVPRSR